MPGVAHPLSDTDPDAARVHIELLRAASPSRRLRLALSLSRTAMDLARAGLARAYPDASPEEIGLRFVALNYGPELAEEVRRHLARSRGPFAEPPPERRS
jgi:hypothetical protein